MSDPNLYTVGWICAIPAEYVAAQEFLDEEHDGPAYLPPPVRNDYSLGKMGKHNVVIATLPMGEYGNVSAARVAEEMRHAFPNIRIGLMVGIGGGVPTRHDIRLGDVVVSTPSNGLGGVLQYDFGMTIQGKSFQRTSFLDQPPTALRTAVTGIQAQYERKGHRLEDAVNNVLARNRRLRSRYKRPDPSSDKLYRSEHIGDDPSYLIQRKERDEEDDNPAIHYGLIASGSQLMKDALMRDKLAKELDVLCFEMEAAGLMNNFPCLVIRGISNYCDSHGNKEWQGYAALIAAAYAKDLLTRITPYQVEAEKKLSEIQTTVNTILEQTQNVSLGVKELRESQEDRDIRSIAEWLTPINYTDHQNDLVNNRQKDTGTWLLESKEFQNWLKQPEEHPIIFCPGIPGAGKTTITSIVISSLQDHFYQLDSEEVGLAYIFCNYRQQEIQNPTALMASLLRQLTKGKHAAPVKGLFEIHDSKQSYPSHEDILETFSLVSCSYSRVIIIIDALDEFQALGGRDTFLSDLVALTEKPDMLISLFATSRYDANIESYFRGSLQRSIHADEGDVRKFLDHKLAKFYPWVSANQHLREEIKTKIAQATDGMFLLAQLYIDALASETTLKGIKSILADLERISKMSKNGEERKEKTLDHAYVVAMRRIESQPLKHIDLAKRVLCWIIRAKQPLTTSLLQHAAAVEIGSRTLDEDNQADIGLSISVCAGLVVIDKKSDVVRLVHYTTQEFFERNWETMFPGSHAYIAKACITYVSLEYFDCGECSTRKALEERFAKFPLYLYSGRYWGSHAKDAMMDGDQVVLDLLQDKIRLQAFSQAIMNVKSSYYSATTTGMNALHVAALFGLHKSLAVILKGSIDVNSTDNFCKRTPLLWAAAEGIQVVQLLLDHGADIELADWDESTALLVAIKMGHEQIARLLIDKGAKINARNRLNHTPLSYAIEVARNESIAKFLVEKGACYDKDYHGYYQSPLDAAITFGMEDLVRLLLNEGYDLSSNDHFTVTPLFSAIEYGHKSLVRLLLQNGVDVNASSYSGYNALFHAIRFEDVNVLKLLLLHGGNIDAEWLGSSLLDFAIWCKHMDAARLLLAWGLGFDKIGPRAARFTLIAVEDGKDTDLKMLRRECLLRNHCAEDGQTTLSIAAEKGFKCAVELLLDAGTDIEARANYEPTWYKSSRHGFTMRRGYDQTALSLAARNGHEDVVKLLLDKGADIESRNSLGCTPLCLAVLNGHESVIHLLLEAGANIESRTSLSQTPLLLAAKVPFEGIAKILLEKGARIEARDSQGLTPLIIAAKNGNRAVVELLLQHGARIEAKGKLRETALLQAIEGEHEDVVRLLVKNQANVKKKGFESRISALDLAREKLTTFTVTIIEKALDGMSPESEKSLQSDSEDPESTPWLPRLNLAAPSESQGIGVTPCETPAKEISNSAQNLETSTSKQDDNLLTVDHKKNRSYSKGSESSFQTRVSDTSKRKSDSTPRTGRPKSHSSSGRGQRRRGQHISGPRKRQPSKDLNTEVESKSGVQSPKSILKPRKPRQGSSTPNSNADTERKTQSEGKRFGLFRGK